MELYLGMIPQSVQDSRVDLKHLESGNVHNTRDEWCYMADLPK
jgi:hypothetical protein